MVAKGKFILCLIFLMVVLAIIVFILGGFFSNSRKPKHDIEDANIKEKNMDDHTLHKQIHEKIQTLYKNYKPNNVWLVDDPEYQQILILGNSASETLLDMLSQVREQEGDINKNNRHKWLVLLKLLVEIREPRVIDHLVYLIDKGHWGMGRASIEYITGKNFMPRNNTAGDLPPEISTKVNVGFRMVEVAIRRNCYEEEAVHGGADCSHSGGGRARQGDS